jgi:hypothetical protein
MAKDFVQMDLLDWGSEPELTEESFNDKQRRLIAERDGIIPGCKHLSIWNPTVCNNCMDCTYWNSEEMIAFRKHPDTGNDGVTHEKFERNFITLPKACGVKIEITISRGDSGKWYFGRSLSMSQEGSGYAAWPKFSEKFDTRYAAISAAVIDTIKWFHDRKLPKKTMNVVLAGLAKFTDCLVPDEEGSESVGGISA